MLEIGCVLWMHAAAVLEREPLDLCRRPFAHGAPEIEVVPDEDPLGRRQAVRGIDDLSNLLLGPRSAAIDLVVQLPEPPPELETKLSCRRDSSRRGSAAHPLDADVGGGAEPVGQLRAVMLDVPDIDQLMFELGHAVPLEPAHRAVEIELVERAVH